MRKLHFVLFVLIALIGVMMAPAALAQDLSDGCQELASSLSINDSSVTLDFFAGEEIEFDVVGSVPAGASWSVTIGGAAVLTDSTGTGFSHTFDADGNFTVATTTSGTSFEITVVCTDATDDGIGDLDPEDKTLCHRPPGNPAAAHTITVGSANAFNTHLAHGDSPGMCSEEENSRADDYVGGLVLYIILDNPDDDIDVDFEGFNLWGNCEEGTCESIISITIVQIYNLSLSLSEGGFEEFEGEDGYSVRLYFLGNQDRDGDGTFEDVMQINIYFNGVLTNDDVLIIFAEDGTASWTMNEDIGVDISILFGDGSSDDDDDSDDDVDDSDDDVDDGDDDSGDAGDDSGDDVGDDGGSS